MHDGRLVDACFVHRGKKLLQRHRALLRPLRLLAADRRHRVTDGIARNDVGVYVDDLRWHAGDLEVLTAARVHVSMGSPWFWRISQAASPRLGPGTCRKLSRTAARSSARRARRSDPACTG